MNERGQRIAALRVDARGGAPPGVRRQRTRVAADVDVAAGFLEPGQILERRVAEHTAEAGLDLLHRRLVRHLLQQPPADAVQARAEEPGEEEDRHRPEGGERSDGEDVAGRVRERADEEQRGDEDERDAAREVDRTEDAPLRRRRLQPAADEHDEHPQEDQQAEDGEDAPQNPGELVVVRDQERVARAALAVVELALEDRRERTGQERGRPEPGDQPPLERRREAPFRVRDHQVDERAEEKAAEERCDPECPTRVGLPEGVDEPEEAGQRQQQADRVLGAERAGDQAAEDEDQPDHGQDHRHRRRVRLVVALRGQDRPDDRKRDERREGAEPEPVHGCELHIRSGALRRRPPKAHSSGETRVRRCRPRARRSR